MRSLSGWLGGLSACIVGFGVLLTGGVALADQPVFPVMNTSEQPPDGVWFRYGPDPSLTTRTTGVGVYAGEHVRVKCWWAGTAFGPYANTIWYYAYDVERPVAAGQSNEGWINTHYVDDGMTANHAHPSVPGCTSGSGSGGDVAGDGGGGGSGGTPPSSISIYYSPYPADDHELSDQSVATVHPREFVTGCTSAKPGYAAAKRHAGGRPIDTLAGWSRGHVGVMYFLARASDDELRQLDYVLLIDPGTYDQTTCDRDLGAGARLAHWLAVNPNAHLAVISTEEFSQQDRSRGIQESYFNDIRRLSTPPRINLRPRVLTCNYDVTHEGAFRMGQYWIRHRIGTTPSRSGRASSCPWLSERGHTYKPSWGWNP
jgi:hypothetical protein